MSTNEIFNQMLSSYDITTELQKRNGGPSQDMLFVICMCDPAEAVGNDACDHADAEF